jgi:PIN domain nuclease of toxin-antitoxin system
MPFDEGAMPFPAGLPPHHRGPFDRLLVAQAMQHGLTVATFDPDVATNAISLLPTA